MIIRNSKKTRVSKTSQKVADTDLFSLYKNDSETLLKTYKVSTSAYQTLLSFHKDEGYRSFLEELSQKDSSEEVINIPLEIINYKSFVYEMILKNLIGYMSLNNLMPKTNLDTFISSLESFIKNIQLLDGIDLTHIGIFDIVYNGRFQILNSEFILLDRVNVNDNIKRINEIVLKNLFDVNGVIYVDERIQECLEYVLCGEIGVDVLLSKIKELEEKEFGKTRYIKHIKKGYIR